MMNNKDLIFFGNYGHTSTSANHIANLAKEYIQEQESILNNVTFYSEDVALIGSSNKSSLHNGISDISMIPELLQEVSEAKSLIAWLREAIKAKQRLTDYWEEYADTEYLKENNISYPMKPVMKQILTEDEYYASLSIKERNRYYTLETEAAVIGKYIHPDGKYSKERKDLANYIQNPHKVTGSGRDTIIYSFTPTMELCEVDDMFFKLQTKHREIQAQLNSIKYQCEQAILASKTEAQEEYINALRNYNAEMEEIGSKMGVYKTEKLKAIGALKIIIPDSLKDICAKVSKLGK